MRLIRVDGKYVIEDYKLWKGYRPDDQGFLIHDIFHHDKNEVGNISQEIMGVGAAHFFMPEIGEALPLSNIFKDTNLPYSVIDDEMSFLDTQYSDRDIFKFVDGIDILNGYQEKYKRLLNMGYDRAEKLQYEKTKLAHDRVMKFRFSDSQFDVLFVNTQNGNISTELGLILN